MWSWLGGGRHDPRRRLELAPRPARPRGARSAPCVSWCCSAASRTWPLARSACPTTTASKAATTMETDTMVRSLPRLAAVRPPRMPRRVRVGTTRSGARRVDGASAPRPAPDGRDCGSMLQRPRAGEWRRRRGRGRWRHQAAPVPSRRPRPRCPESDAVSSARWPAGGRSRSGGWRRPPPPTASARRGRRAGDARRRRRRRAGRGGRRTRRRRPRRRSASSAGPRPSGS